MLIVTAVHRPRRIPPLLIFTDLSVLFYVKCLNIKQHCGAIEETNTADDAFTSTDILRQF